MQDLASIEVSHIDREWMEKAQKRLDNLTKPMGSLGRLEELAKKVVGIKRDISPSLSSKVIFTFVADHGVSEEGVSAYPREVTAQMVYNFLEGGAAINVLAGHVGARVRVIDIGVASKIEVKEAVSGDFVDKKINFGTKNMLKGSAMTRDEAVKSIETGIELLEAELQGGIDIAGTGDMGIGNTTPSSAVAAAITGRPVEEVTGRGTGIDDKALTNKIGVIKKALLINKPDSEDAIDVLAKVGGFELGGIAGVILGAASNRIPVVIDGFISGAAALIAYQLRPQAGDYMIAAHCSAERGHRVILDPIGLRPLLDLDLRLGEGTGAALGMGLVEAGVKILTRMATFESAGVSEKAG